MALFVLFFVLFVPVPAMAYFVVCSGCSSRNSLSPVGLGPTAIMRAWGCTVKSGPVPGEGCSPGGSISLVEADPEPSRELKQSTAPLAALIKSGFGGGGDVGVSGTQGACVDGVNTVIPSGIYSGSSPDCLSSMSVACHLNRPIVMTISSASRSGSLSWTDWMRTVGILTDDSCEHSFATTSITPIGERSNGILRGAIIPSTAVSFATWVRLIPSSKISNATVAIMLATQPTSTKSTPVHSRHVLCLGELKPNSGSQSNFSGNNNTY